MDLPTIWNNLITTLQGFFGDNWSLVVGIVAVYIAKDILKASARAIGGIVTTAVGIAVLTNLGVLPPIEDLVAMVGNLIQGVNPING